MNRLVYVVWTGLSLIALSAAVLSFSSLQQLAVMCGYEPKIAWLLPITTDLAAATCTIVWLGATGLSVATVDVARNLTWTALALSVVGNGLEHGLSAYHVAPHWIIVVLVSAVPPAALGAVVHVAVLTIKDVAPETPGTVPGKPASVAAPTAGPSVGAVRGGKTAPTEGQARGAGKRKPTQAPVAVKTHEQIVTEIRGMRDSLGRMPRQHDARAQCRVGLERLIPAWREVADEVTVDAAA